MADPSFIFWEKGGQGLQQLRLVVLEAFENAIGDIGPVELNVSRLVQWDSEPRSFSLKAHAYIS